MYNVYINYDLDLFLNFCFYVSGMYVSSTQVDFRGPTRGLGDLERRAIYFQRAWEHSQRSGEQARACGVLGSREQRNEENMSA